MNFFWWLAVVESVSIIIFGLAIIESIYTSDKTHQLMAEIHQANQEWMNAGKPEAMWNFMPAEVQVNMLEESFNKDEQ
jgi:hypothetical protein